MEQRRLSSHDTRSPGHHWSRWTSARSRLVRFLAACAVLGALIFATRTASAGDYVLYLHGRDMSTWPSYGLVLVPESWVHIALTYNGSARIADPTARSQVSSAMKSYCSGGNNCIIVCYSAGCYRELFGLYDLKQAGTPPKGILWVEAAGSASGGTEAVRYLHNWFKDLMARIFGLTAPIDQDLDPNQALGTYSYIQNLLPAPQYDSQGSKNICMDILFFKICANQYIESTADGAVPAHSGCGYTNAGAHSSCCDGSAKFTNHNADACALYQEDHYGMFAVAVIEASNRFGYKNPLAFAHGWSGNSEGVCNPAYDDCFAQINKADSFTIAGALNISPPATDVDTRPDQCYACDATGCAHCREFSVAQPAYTTCNALKCTPTLSSANGPLGLGGADEGMVTVTGGNTVSFGGESCNGFGICTVPLVFTTKGGVTVTQTPPGTCMSPGLSGIGLTAAGGLQFDYSCSAYGGTTSASTTLTFHGATVFFAGSTGIVAATASGATEGDIFTMGGGGGILGPSSATYYIVANSDLN
jgi:hypothetical protein